MTNNYFLPFLTLFTFILLTGCQPSHKLPEVIQIATHWEFKKDTDSIWRSAHVPGNIFSDLLHHQLIEDPFVGTNEKKVQWVSETPWEYKTHFLLSKTTLEKQNISLNFSGLDTYATIFLNDAVLGSTANAFRSYSFNCKDKLQENNVLKIVFTPTAVKEEKFKQQQQYSLPEGNRIFTRKGQFQYGWDWGPTLNTSGIWKPISLKAWDTATIEDIFIQQNSLSEIEATLTAHVTIQSSEEKEATITFKTTELQQEKAIFLKKGTHTYQIPIRIKNPTLWWVHNWGTPHLYEFHFSLISNKTMLDKKVVKKGLRTIKLLTQKDSIGETFYFELNGKPLYAKGANYIPLHSFQNEVTPEKYQQLLQDVTNANMNMLRVWGGGIYENDVFYELCDEKGILVWQDFMFACAMYPGNDEFLNNVKQEAEEQVKRLRNYASIALWCGNNENSEGWHRWGWQANRTEEEKQTIWKDYTTLFKNILPNIVERFSDATSYWESSPKYGRGNPNYQFEGDAHDWKVWHDAAPFEHFEEKIPRFMSEFGFQSFPSFEVLQYINQQDSIDIHTKAITSHQKHHRGFELMQIYMERDYPVPTLDEDYVYISQLVQARGIVLGIEAHRRAKPYNMGTLYWQLNDCWPAISWSGIDYFGNWKALHYKVKKAFKNQLVSTKITNDSISVFIINDALQAINSQITLQLIDFNGTELWKSSIDITASENGVEQITQIPLQNIDVSTTVLVSNFMNQSRTHFLTKPKELKLEKRKISPKIKKIKEGFSIEISSDVLLKDVFLFCKEKGHFSDNFFDILPNETKRIVFKTNATTLNNLHVKMLNDM